MKFLGSTGFLRLAPIREHSNTYNTLPRISPAISLAALIITYIQLTAARNCQELNLSVPLTATNTILNLPSLGNNIAVTDFILNLTETGRNLAQELSTGSSQISGTYHVGATLCTPPDPSTTLQVLSHGIGFTRTYWDFPAYSYVDAALARGYATLAYDRLGSGVSRFSSRTEGDLDPVNELQAPLEVALLSALTQLARSGGLQQSENNATFDRVLHVGHSLGSISIYGAVTAEPMLSDGIALTGFTADGSYVPYFQFASNFVSAVGGQGDYPAGYVTFATSSALHTNQFAPGGAFDAGLLEPLFQDLQPTGLGSILTLGGPLASVNGFQGPVLDVTGTRDLPFCGGNCEAVEPSLPAQVGGLFPNASKFEAVVVPGAGHALNLHLSWETTYTAILDFFDTLTT
ncbi:hypothetical protein N0V93_001377 [Gnomoniopsis smithogilvyi]|uniref:AB hydrolase-1 domain-containing protein n=1 Tax=Gnomoniopsis smithogilvyi TaxID=1191159 RepID=A0A9W8Z3M9_9PEZI|nr:hypothetical protein N0V93_001377 [Gnomoniopsis smithogilvyi]